MVVGYLNAARRLCQTDEVESVPAPSDGCYEENLQSWAHGMTAGESTQITFSARRRASAVAAFLKDLSAPTTCTGSATCILR